MTYRDRHGPRRQWGVWRNNILLVAGVLVIVGVLYDLSVDDGDFFFSPTTAHAAP